jgi:hypothetical protein
LTQWDVIDGAGEEDKKGEEGSAGGQDEGKKSEDRSYKVVSIIEIGTDIMLSANVLAIAIVKEMFR